VSVSVTGRNGHRLAHARVTLDGHRTRFTDANGLATFTGVRSGHHDIRIAAADEKTLTADVSLHPGQNQLAYQLGGTGRSLTLLIWIILVVAVAVLAAAASTGWRVLSRRRRHGAHRRSQAVGRAYY
jgi:hypothetical protein